MVATRRGQREDAADHPRSLILPSASSTMTSQLAEPAKRSSPAGASDVVIETRSLTKIYRDFWGRQKVRALSALDLEIRRGEIFGLLGPKISPRRISRSS